MKNNKFFKILHATVMLVIIGMLLGTIGYVAYVNKHGYTYKMGDWSNKYKTTLNTSKQWGEGAHGYEFGMQYDGVVYNMTDENVTDWEIRIKFIKGCNVDSYWNGTVVFENDIMTLTSHEFNRVVEAHNSQPFGFVLHADSMDNVIYCTVTFYNRIEVTEIMLFWISLILLGGLIIVDVTLLIVHYRNKELYERQRIAQRIIDQSFNTFANIIDAKDPYTKGHSLRVAQYAQMVAKKMKLSKEQQERIYMVGSVHDIGKVGVPDGILQKDGKLTPEERDIIKHHVDIGGDILMDFTAVPGIQEGARYHHERYGGGGYSSGIVGEEIPLFARIIGVADAFDAMCSNRCYRQKLSLDTVVEELKRCRGTQFDPGVVDIFLELIEEGLAPINAD